MPKLIDLTGQRFGRWTVLQKAESRNKHVYWLCKCDCGTIKEVKGASLREGKSQSCGCLHKQLSKKICSQVGKKNIRNLIGQQFGEWTVLKDSGKRRSNGGIIWTCQCSCGTIKDVRGHSLISGYSTNCGCKKINSKGELKIFNLLTENQIPFKHEYSFNDCRFEDTKQLARFDFYVNNSYIIEFDGQQHFIYSDSEKTWNTKEHFLKTKERDEYKNQWCRKNNIPLIRIPYTQYQSLTIDDLLLETTIWL